ncbi:MAG: PAS domain-containing protein [Verrucomicrobiota bacterium]|nr:PAS domain-containing protein [Verrucomicrobiota bacterium]
MFLLDPEGCIVQWNTGAEHIFGFPKEEAIGQTPGIFARTTREFCVFPTIWMRFAA